MKVNKLVNHPVVHKSLVLVQDICTVMSTSLRPKYNVGYHRTKFRAAVHSHWWVLVAICLLFLISPFIVNIETARVRMLPLLILRIDVTITWVQYGIYLNNPLFVFESLVRNFHLSFGVNTLRMLYLIMLKCFILATLYFDMAVPVIYYGPVWTYDDELNWPGNRCKEGGKRQSPIDIRTTDVVKDFSGHFIKYGPLKFRDYEKVLVTGFNNGHTVQFSTDGEESMHPTLTGGPLKHVYRLEQLHFHWLSEHAVNGIKYPMEIHFVHVRADLPVSSALGKRDGLAIMSVFCNVQADLDDYQQEASDEIMQHMSRLLTTGDRVSGIILDMTKLLRVNTESYFSYLGSLTSPECNEVVIWIIFDKPIYISDAQYRLFGKIGVGRHNFRSLQKLGHHLVFQPPAAFVTTPKIVRMVHDVVLLVSEFFKNITKFMSKGMKTP